MERAKLHGMKFLSNRERGLQDAVMFDIDDTLIKRNGTPIEEMITLYKFAEMIGYTMIIITARPYNDENARWTTTDLLEIGINPSKIYFTPADLKSSTKQKLGYTFALSVGDQWTDLTDSIKWIKLPDSIDVRLMAN